MEVEYSLTPEDVAAWMSDYSSGRPRRWLPYIGLALATVPLVAEIVRLVALRAPWPIVAAFVLFIPAIFGVFLFRKRLLRLFMRRADTPTKSQRLALRPEGLTITTETTASLTAWEGVDRIVVTDTHAFFYFNKVAALILPRRAFADENEFENFVERARSYHESARPR